MSHVLLCLDILAALFVACFVFANRTRWPQLPPHPHACHECGRAFANAQVARWHAQGEQAYGPLRERLAAQRRPRLRVVAAAGPLDRFTLPPGVTARPALKVVK